MLKKKPVDKTMRIYYKKQNSSLHHEQISEKKQISFFHSLNLIYDYAPT